MRVILCGYNWIGCKALDILLQQGKDVFVFTHKSDYYINSVEEYCQKRCVPYSLEKISGKNLPYMPDLILSIYYRYIIKEDVIKSCGGKIFNLHPSLLPDYKGCSSLTWAMIDGRPITGYSYHYLTPAIDEGNIILQKEIVIEDFDTQVSLYYRVMFEAVKDLLNVVELVMNGYEGVAQDASGGKYFRRGAPYQGIINPEWSGEQKERFIRAMIFPPLPLATFNGNIVKSMSDITSGE